jgi:hypothetical protein
VAAGIFPWAAVVVEAAVFFGVVETPPKKGQKYVEIMGIQGKSWEYKGKSLEWWIFNGI